MLFSKRLQHAHNNGCFSQWHKSMWMHIRNIINYINEYGFLAALSLVIQRKMNRKYIALRPYGIAHELKFRHNTSDFAVLRQVIGNREVYFDLSQPPENIIDAGANIGLSSIVFANRWPSAKILAIEPDNENFCLLSENTKKYPNITCLRAAVWHHTAQVTIKNPDAAAFAFQVEENDTNENLQAFIPAITISDCIKLMKIEELDLLKLDIEGAEYDLFGDSRQTWINQVTNIAIEPHERFVPGVLKRIEEACSDRKMVRRGEYMIFSQKVSSCPQS